jgi:LuxR family transcriptional regulator, maltose regulon positive regulatory protein
MRYRTLGRVPPPLSLVPVAPVTRPGPGTAPVGPPVPPAALRLATADEIIVAVRPGEADAVGGPVAGPAAGGVVARPRLFGRLDGPARVTVVSALPGSGKTVLLRSWINEAAPAGRVAWAPVGREERDPQNFWVSVVAALRRTAPGAALVGALGAVPELDGWALVERLLADLAPLADRVWLVLDDVHELGPEALRQLELLVMRAPPALRFVLSGRHDVRLGLHRLRLEGELTEIRAPDLRFSPAEAGELFAGSGVALAEPTVAVLHERTEGWAAGLRLAALSLAGHPDPERFAAEFSGTERTVAEYLLAEVLDRQPAAVRRLLLCTSILDRVNGNLADLLTSSGGGERVLQDLEQANAFVVPLDGARSWFRYHQMFAGLLRLELRRAAAGEVAGLHRRAAGWFAGHGYPVEAVRHAQAAGDWGLAARLLADHWPALHLDGQAAAVHELLAGFPAEARAADAELAVLAAGDELARGSLEAAERYLTLAEQRSASVPEGRRGQCQVLLGIVRLLHARQRANPAAAAEAAQRLQAAAEAPEAAQPHLSADLRALALISLGWTEIWTTQWGQAHRHLQQGVALARRIGRPFLEFNGLADLAIAEIARPVEGTDDIEAPFVRRAERARQAIELAERHGWTDEPAFGIACRTLGVTLAWQGRPEEAEPLVQQGERTVTAETDPGAAVGVYFSRGLLELARRRDSDALAAFEAAERLAERLERLKAANVIDHHARVMQARAMRLSILVRLGDTERAEEALAGLGERELEGGDVRVATAALLLAGGRPHDAAVALAPVLDGTAPLVWMEWLTQAFLLEAIARDALGDQHAADWALERALDLAEPNGAVLTFLLYPAPALLARYARHRTAHAALSAEILGLLAGSRSASPPAGPRPPVEPLSNTELRVLRYLPTNLTSPEIARELSVSPNTIRTHIKNLYAKLGAHRRAEAVARARDLGLLAPSGRGVGYAHPRLAPITQTG